MYLPMIGSLNERRGSDPERHQRLRREQFFGLQPALGQALLMMVAPERLEHGAVGLAAVGPPGLAELPARLLYVRRPPREHRGERHGGAEGFVGPAPRLDG